MRKKNLFYPAVHITEVMEKLGRDIYNTDNYPFPLYELENRVGKYYADQILSGAVDSVVHRRDFELGQIRFEWDATGKYAPGIRFAVMANNGPTVDENGFLSSPIWYDRADLVLPFLNFDFRGNTADALVVWGNYARTDFDGNKLKDGNDPNLTDNQKAFWRTGGGQIEIVHNFCRSDIGETTHVLIVIPWGGAHSDTRGQSEKILAMTNSFDRGLEFFQQCASNKYGEGYDFYIIDISKAVAKEAWVDFETMLMRSFYRADEQQQAKRVAFHRKYIAFQARRKEYAKFKEEATRIEDLLNERYKKEIRGAAVAERSCVVLPEKIGSVYDYLELPKQPADYTCSLEEMNQARIPAETWKRLEVAKDVLNAKMDAWLDFAPRYADLADLVILGCHGTAEVYLNCLKMTMPSICPLEYEFSEAHLGSCVTYIQEFLSDSQAKRESSLSAISKLIEKTTGVTAG